MAKNNKAELSQQELENLLSTLKARFEANMRRHPALTWDEVESKLKAVNSKKKLWALYEMERTGGEPDVLGYEKKTDAYIFFDCSVESPDGRRSVCYDRAGLESRKSHRPDNTAIDMADEMGIEILTEEEYRHLQTFGEFDSKTSSWLKTPPEIRTLGGAIFGDFRFGQVFVYHNGAQSYYASRGFRGRVSI
jgi:hypothetical protein